MTKRTFVIGAQFDAPHIRAEMDAAEAIQVAARQADKGYVWMLQRGRYTIVGNYAGGQVWNGQAQCVPASADDWIEET